MDKGQNNRILCLLGLTAFLIFLKMHKTYPSDLSEFGLCISGLTAIRFGYLYARNEIQFLRTKRKLIKKGKKYKNNKNEIQVADSKSAYIESIWEEMKKN